MSDRDGIPQVAAVMAASPAYPCRVRLRKLAVLPGRAPGRIPLGVVFVGEAVAPPRPGERFHLINCLITSTVQQLLDAETFSTRNSIYHLEVVSSTSARAILRVQRFRRRLVQAGLSR